MKKRALKTAVIAFEVIALLIAIAAAAVIFLSWRLGQGPVELGLLKPSAEFAIERRLPKGYEAKIGGIGFISAGSVFEGCTFFDSFAAVSASGILTEAETRFTSCVFHVFTDGDAILVAEGDNGFIVFDGFIVIVSTAILARSTQCPRIAVFTRNAIIIGAIIVCSTIILIQTTKVD